MLSQLNQLPIAVLGAGPTGSVLALMLAKKGFNVEVFDSKSNQVSSSQTDVIDQSMRKINYAVSLRGVQAFEEVQLWDKIKKSAIPMSGRIFHNYNGSVKHHHYGKKD